MRYINLADNKGRFAEVLFAGFPKKANISIVDKQGNEVENLRVLKNTAHNSYESLLNSFKSPDKLFEALVNTDPEIDLLYTGRFIKNSSKIYIDNQLKPLTKVLKKERIFKPDGSLVEEREQKEISANINVENPIRPVKLLPKKEVFQKLILSKKYQIKHNNGLTFDFLFEIAKELHEKDSILWIGAGVKGTEPLVFQEDGKSYRAFLEGRIEGKSYILILHLSNLELKSIKID
jgi:hypothetical protein